MENDQQQPVKRKRGRPKGPCSEREIQQRREAAPLAARARSPQGKLAVSRNGWKHGRYAKGALKLIGGKPCKSTCDHHPCSFVNEGRTRPGKPCLADMDAERLEHVAQAVYAAIVSRKPEDNDAMNELAALELAGNINLLSRLREEINEKGVMIERPLFDRGGNKIGTDLVENPAIPLLLKLSNSLGLNLQEFLATPMTRQKVRGEVVEAETAAAIARRLMDRLSPPRPFTEAEIVDPDG